ncbi:Pyruvate/Phosphoenolpyruvate kinase-like domain-containing protein [Dactylonectria estremocensis]|uniref:Pyruvate/Phosphoenolpyruvate kinase-like domain-containing protein n=1 Tax=Dactylonectria estremocensis TaxID=1079267 RepID=A0A9P9F2W2_9HYPO|nr:Pyruvate/Phosphoenolpyruvate kinase-like domain-containing protein [Dactylonectria estremocensis]
MTFPTPLGTALQSRTSQFGFWLTLPSAALARVFLRAASASPFNNFSWVLIDAEHGLISDKDYYELSTAIASEGASPIIRVPWHEEWMIKRALDAGAHGVLLPMCHSAEDAKRIVSYSKYPPLGSRGYGPMFSPHSLPGVAGGQYDDGADQSLLVMVQIESRSGVENVEAIAKTEGLDVLLIGPFDLAKQMGVVRGGEEHEAAIQKILKASHDAGKKAAIFCSNGSQALTRAEQGFDMVSIITDLGAVEEGITQTLQAASGKSSQGEQGQRDGY